MAAKPLSFPPILKDPFQRLGLDREVLTVSQLNQRARHLLEDVFPQVWVDVVALALRVMISVVFVASPRSAGTADRRSATWPATCGPAIDVPLMLP